MFGISLKPLMSTYSDKNTWDKFSYLGMKYHLKQYLLDKLTVILVVAVPYYKALAETSEYLNYLELITS